MATWISSWAGVASRDDGQSRQPRCCSATQATASNSMPEKSAPFARVGLVTGAVFTDLNGDGAPDLVLACEWGPLRVFINNNGRFSEATQRLGLDAFVGWWNGVTAGDFDGDGRLDLVASNWGLNSSHQTAHEAQMAFSTSRRPTFRASVGNSGVQSAIALLWGLRRQRHGST